MSRPVHIVVDVGDPAIRFGLIENLRVEGHDVVATAAAGGLPPLLGDRRNLLILDADLLAPSDCAYLSARPSRSVVVICRPEHCRQLADQLGPALGGVFARPFDLKALLACVTELANSGESGPN